MSAKLRFWLVSFIALVLVGCQTLRPTPLVDAPVRQASVPASDASLHGRVDFSGRTTQATPADVVNAATVSFLDTGTNQTVATGKTDAAGNFTLTLGGYSPITGGTYLLEAVKGLNAQAPGSDAARFRTILQWDGSGWLSCTNSSVPGTIVINSLTTALAIETALDAANVPAANTIGKVNAGTNPATLNAAPTYINHPDSEITQLAADLLSYLGADTDPLSSVPTINPTLSTFQPTTGGPNSLVRISGAGFSPVPSGNTVTFNGTTAQVILATPTSLVVVVPSGATTGTLRVQTGRGSVTSGSNFTVVADGASLFFSSITPATVRAGDTVTLQGQFGSGTGVVMLGSLPCATVSVSPTSLSVTVPFGAVSGPVTYQLGSATVTSSQRLHVKPGDLGAFVDQASASELPTNLYHSFTVDYNGSVYLIGGDDGAGSPAFDHVLRARYQSDGTLSPWERVGRMLAPRSRTAAIIRNGILYIVGGTDNTVGLKSVEKATINADGTLGPFSLAGNLLLERRHLSASLVNDRLYVVGGYKDAAPNDVSSIEMGTFDAAGNLTFANAGNIVVGATTYTCRHHASAVAGSTILIFGGVRTAGASVWSGDPRVIRIPVNANGTLGTMSFSANQMAQPKYNIYSVTANGKVYIGGGQYYYVDASSVGHYTTYQSIDVATLDAVAGDVGPIANYGSRLVGGRWASPMSFNANRLYMYGGYYYNDNGGAGSHPYKNIEVMNVLGDGSVDTAQVLGAMRPRYGHMVVMVNNVAYIIGGYRAQTSSYVRDVEMVTFSPDGVASVPRVTATLTQDRNYMSTVAIGSYLYVLGGLNATGNLSSIERAQINPDGTLGSFVPYTASELPMQLRGIAVARIGNWLYISGGISTGTTLQQHTARAPIYPDDSIGPFQMFPSADLPVPHAYPKGIVVGNYYYVFGGANASETSGAVYRSRIATDGSLLGFQAWTSLPGPNWATSAAVIGNYLYVFGYWSNTGASSAVLERAPITGDGDLGAWQTGPSMVTGRGRPGVVTVGDRVFVFGGYAGGGTYGSMPSIEAAAID